MKELRLRFEQFLNDHNFPDYIVPYVVFLALLLTAGVLMYLSVFITKQILERIVGRLFKRTKNDWDDLLIRHHLFSAIGYVVSVIVLKIAVPSLFEDFPKTLVYINRIIDAYFVFVIIRILIVFLRATEDHLSHSRLFIEKPLASYFQLFRIILYIIAFILGLSIILSKSPLYLLGAFGAMTAVLLLIFKDTILGLVASIQISSNDMVRIGDSIEMPNHNADGDVIAINLNTVKIRNYDNTITTVPTYFFITEGFKNWRGMQMSGGRRIKRAIQISMASIKFADQEMLNRFLKIDIVKDYVKERQSEIETFNMVRNVDTAVLINGRRMTNIGVFRVYMQKYVENHPGIHQGMSIMVRQLTPGEFGIPIEVYCFTNTTKWAEYENIQSDIFDHIMATVHYFELDVFQSPSGSDLSKFRREVD